MVLIFAIPRWIPVAALARLGIAVSVVITADPSVVLQPAAERPLYYRRAIVPADLENRSLRELSLMRNWIFARAGNPFRRDWLREFFAAQEWYRPRAKLDHRLIDSLDRANSFAIARHELALTREVLIERRDRLLSLPRPGEAERIELELIGERLGDALDHDGRAPHPLEKPALLDGPVTLEQLADYSRRDLALLRNLIYARRGRPFASPHLAQRFATLEGYRPESSYTNRRLTPVDRRNLKLIRSLENELGGPLRDGAVEEWLFAA